MDRLLEEVEVSVDRISWLLRSRKMSHHIDDDGHIYVNDDDLEFPFWIAVKPAAKSLHYFTYWFNPPDGWSIEEYDFVTRVSFSPVCPRFELLSGRLNGTYHLSFAGGIIVQHIIEVAQGFSAAFATAIAHGDRGLQFRSTRH